MIVSEEYNRLGVDSYGLLNTWKKIFRVTLVRFQQTAKPKQKKRIPPNNQETKQTKKQQKK